MSERLVIRLGASFEQPCQWMLWSEQNSTIIQHGELPNADSLSDITELSDSNPVDVFVSSTALTITQVPLPEKGKKQAIKAIPFILEESLVDNIENLHFVVGPQEGDMVDVVVVSHEQMLDWTSWLANAGIKPRQMVPDCLALPLVEGKWSAIAFDNEYLFRTSMGQGAAIPKSWTSVILPRILEDQEEIPMIICYSPMELGELAVEPHYDDLPILCLFHGLAFAEIDLLTGGYKSKRKLSKHFFIWKNVALVAGICILLSLANKGINIHFLNEQIDKIKAENEQIYHQAIPGSSRIVNLRSQMGNELKRLQQKGGGAELFDMLTLLKPAFADVPELRPTSLRFDGNRNEIRMQVTADSFGEIEKFSELAKQHFKLDTGSINNVDDKVSSTIVLREI